MAKELIEKFIEEHRSFFYPLFCKQAANLFIQYLMPASRKQHRKIEDIISTRDMAILSWLVVLGGITKQQAKDTMRIFINSKEKLHFEI